MSSRKTIYLTDDSEKIIGSSDSLSGRINSIIGRYEKVTTDSMPAFTAQEWCAICDANNGTIVDDQPQSVSYMWANIADSPELDEKWKIDRMSLAEKVRDLSFAEQCSIAEVVRAFWSNDWSQAKDYADVFQAIGAIKK
jgi:hypothetical protein